MAHETLVYKATDSVTILADVHRTEAGNGPVIVWIHGGALIFGSRKWMAEFQRERYLSAGYTVVSIDYRLAPETPGETVISDVVDAVDWTRTELPTRMDIDPHRLALIGHSGGGYLALAAASRVEPRPSAVVSFYGYGDLVGPWYSQPSSFYRQQPLVEEAVARAKLGDHEIADASDANDRGLFYLYCRQQGIWPREVFGHDPDVERDRLLPFCPDQNVDDGFPPTLLLHGDLDTDVPYECSVAMAQALKAAGIQHELITIEGGGHGFDGEEPANGQLFMDHVLEFLAKHLSN